MPVETYPDWMFLGLEEGRFSYKVGRAKAMQVGECSAGGWILCPPGWSFHRVMLEPCSFHYARFSVEGRGLENLTGCRTLRNAARVRANLSLLREAPYTEAILEWKGHLLMDLFRAAAWEEQTGINRQPTDAAMERVREMLEGRWMEPLSLAQVAREIRLTPAAFSRRFKVAVGQAPQEFLLNRRCDHARQLLLESDLTVDAIARQCGFTNGFYFSRFWTKRYGTPPGRFRREHRV